MDSRLRGNDERGDAGMTKEGGAGMTRRGEGGMRSVLLVFFGVCMRVGMAYFHGKWVSGAGF